MGDYFIDLSEENLDEAKEPKALAGEYTVAITDWKTDDDGKIRCETAEGKGYLMPKLEVVDCPEAEYSKGMSHFMWLPEDWMDAKKLNGAKFTLKEFFTAFGIDTSQQIDPEETIGSRAEAILVVTDDPEYGEQSRIKRFVVSH